MLRLHVIKFLRSLTPAGNVAASQASDALGALSDGSDASPGNAWMLWEHLIFIGRAIVNRLGDLHRTAEIDLKEIMAHDQGP